jgi:hypothetical protein
MQLQSVSAGELCFDILRNEFHLPLIDGKANRDNIEDAIVVGVLRGELGYIDKETVDLTIELVDDLLALYNLR